MIRDPAKLLGNLNGEKSYLINLSPKDLQADILAIINFLVNKRQWNCIYLSSTKPYSSIKKNLESKDFNLKKFFFIDTVTGSSEEKIENVMFIPSPSALTSIDLTATQLIQFVQSHGFLIIDTLEGLSINNEPEALANFIRSIIKRVTKYNSKIIVLTGGGMDEKFVNVISTFFEKTINPEDLELDIVPDKPLRKVKKKLSKVKR
jgi:hypothetical protein